MSEENGNKKTISHNTRVTLAVLGGLVPFVIWAAQIDQRVKRLEEDRVEDRKEWKMLIDTMNKVNTNIEVMKQRQAQMYERVFKQP